MDQDHPDAEVLARYARGELGREESRGLERHLAGCVACQEEVDRMPVRAGGVVRWQGHRFSRKEEPPPRDDPERRENLRGVIRALGGILATTHEQSLARLLKEPEHRRRVLIRQEDRYHTLGLCELLEARCRTAWIEDPVESVEYAKLAALVAQRLDSKLFGGRKAADVRTLVWAHLGISFRLAAPDRWQGVAEGGEIGAPGDPEAYPEGALGAVVIRDGADRFAEVEAALREIRDACLERGMGYEAALVTLDLVSACLEREPPGEVLPLAREAVELFEAHPVETYALEAMRFLGDSAEAGSVTPEVVGRMARLLRRKRGGFEQA